MQDRTRVFASNTIRQEGVLISVLALLELFALFCISMAYADCSFSLSDIAVYSRGLLSAVFFQPFGVVHFALYALVCLIAPFASTTTQNHLIPSAALTFAVFALF